MANGSGNVSNVDNIGSATNSALPAVVLPHNTQVIELTAGCVNSNQIFIFQKCAGTAQGAYQVTTGKTFKAIGYWVFTTSAANGRFIFAQSTAAPTQGGSVGTPPAGSIFYNSTGTIASASDATLGSGHAVGNTANATGAYWVPAPGLEFTSDYYPYIVNDGAIAFSVVLVGYEV